MTQSLDNIVDVTVTVSPLSIANSAFNLGLIVGDATVISAADRVKLYSSTEAMIAEGWAGTEDEYLAAQVYFSQTPRPSKVAIGRWDTTGSETAAAAVTACRVKNSDWYAVYVCTVLKANILAIAAVVEAATPLSVYFFDTQDADVLTATAGNVLLTLKTATRHRSWGQYSTTDHAAVAAMGVAMGSNTGLANSAYTLAYKTEVGIQPETLTTTQYDNILGANGNVYTSFGASYNLLVQGKMADGISFDEVLNLDVLTNDIQTAVINALRSGPKIPQTEGGVSLLVSAITDPCNNALNRGVIGPGTWKAAPILGLKTGDTLSTGYMILAESTASQSQADRDARIAPPIYVAIKLAGAIEHVVIGIIANR
ncbi:DUF3383 family protein [Paenibacillus agricola]|uniref:DUF3383 domain-containing protein n=1 Tax=Paenibacillus agricola TaxID=2716264 RepID=A0ABX0JBL7_9BACL|nr:DUF3383 family protein [Paenibacillus agricola]NHN33542.1 DUF3383 domain-containing protein [Paenibacillus agricola]